MLWLDKHTRFRHSLSPYIDGRLTPAEVERLKTHLDSCDGCQSELDELRATASALRDLPDVEVSRSFALTPQMLERRTVNPVPSAPPLAFGMRLASGVLAVVLAVVLIGDLSSMGDGVDDGREAANEQAADSETTLGFGAAGGEPAATDAADQFDLDDETAERDSSLTPAPPTEGATESCPNAATAGTGASGGVGGPGAPGASPTVTPSPETPTTSAAVEASAACDDTVVGAAAPEVTATPEDVSQPTDEELAGDQAAATDDGSGISALRVLEFALAGSLVALLAAVAVEFALRRQKLT